MSSSLDGAKTIFLQALEIGRPDERDSFIKSKCADDEALQAEVERLLGHHNGVGSFLESPLISPNSDATFDQFTESPGDQIGPYKIRELLGEGGMGTVYVAEQDEPIRRKVALKVIKPGMDSKAVIARFEAERQALALMDHPHIAKVLDAGTTNLGRPYFVMELVRGISIVEFCDQQQLSNAVRLELFMTVCRAVQHAHSKGVIHRDLKPSNVLVSPHDGKPIVKVIDFGVAKAIGQQLTDKSIYTQFSQMIGTPLYMSPEQAELNALDVDTRSDVYSLGVLLYELITGTTPFEGERFAAAALDEIRRIICEEDPPKPSTRISALSHTIDPVSKPQNAPIASVDVPGDLDWVVMKALEKDRTRRYETATALAADVHRVLNQQPVEARPPSAWYQFQKFAQRNRTLLATACAVGFTIMAAIVATSSLSVVAVQGWQRASEQETIARANQRKLRAHNENLTTAQAFQALAVGDLDYARGLIEKLQADYGGRGMNTFESRLLKEQLQCRLPVLSRTDVRATRAVFTSDSSQLIVGQEGPMLRVYDVSNLDKAPSVVEIEGSERWSKTTSIALLPNDSGVIAGGALASGLGALAVRESTAGNLSIIQTFASEVTDVEISDDGTVLLTTKDGSLQAWKRQDVQPTWTASVLDDHNRENHEALSHPSFWPHLSVDGDLVVTAAWGNMPVRIKVWARETGRLITQVDVAHFELGVEWLKGQRRVAVTHGTGTSIMGLKDGKLVLENRVPYRAIRATVDPTGRELAAADETGGIRFFDLATLHQFDRVVHSHNVTSVRSLCYSADGSHIASVDKRGSLKVFDLRAMRPTSRFRKRDSFAFTGITSSPSSRFVALTGFDEYHARLWDPNRNEMLTIGEHFHLRGMAISQNGKLAASCNGGAVSAQTQIWEVDNPGVPLYQRRFLGAKHAAFSPKNQEEVAIAGVDRIFIWAPRTDKVRELGGFDRPCKFMSIAYSPNGRYLAAGGGIFGDVDIVNDGRFLLWDLHSTDDRPIAVIERQRIVYEVAFRPDGTECAIGGLDSEVSVYRIATKKNVSFRDESGWVTGLAYTADGDRLATASSYRVTFWDADTHARIGSFHIPEHVRRVGFLADGSGMITISLEGFARFWKAARLNNLNVIAERHPR